MKNDTEAFSPDDELFTFDSIELRWVKCKIKEIGENTVILEGIEGGLKDFIWIENRDILKDPDYYRTLNNESTYYKRRVKNYKKIK